MVRFFMPKSHEGKGFAHIEPLQNSRFWMKTSPS